MCIFPVHGDLHFGASLGVPLGFLLIGWLDEDVVKIILAVLVTGYAAYCLASRHALVLKTDRTAPLFGLVSGLLCGAYNTGGPPLVVYGTAQGWAAVKFRATLQGVFFPISLSIVGGHALVGTLSGQVLWFFLWSLPVMFVAIMLGRGLNKRIGDRQFLVYVYWLLILIGIVLLIHSARGFLRRIDEWRDTTRPADRKSPARFLIQRATSGKFWRSFAGDSAPSPATGNQQRSCQGPPQKSYRDRFGNRGV